MLKAANNDASSVSSFYAVADFLRSSYMYARASDMRCDRHTTQLSARRGQGKGAAREGGVREGRGGEVTG